MQELRQRFAFQGVHTLHRRIRDRHEQIRSQRLHGHDYQATVMIRGNPDPETGMIMDIALLKERFEAIRQELEGNVLDDVVNNGPPTIENLARWIWDRLRIEGLASVTVSREVHGDSSTYYGPPNVSDNVVRLPYHPAQKVPLGSILRREDGTRPVVMAVIQNMDVVTIHVETDGEPQTLTYRYDQCVYADTNHKGA